LPALSTIIGIDETATAGIQQVKRSASRGSLLPMTTEPEIAPFAAAVYTPQTADRTALLKFVEKQKAKRRRIGGVLQVALLDASGNVAGLNAVDVATGQRIPITRPVQRDDECSLDVSALADTTGIIERAISDRVDLVVVEKFGEMEQGGGGLIDEIMQTIVAGIPLLIAVPEAALPLWQERSGELGRVLEFSEDAFEQWWREIGQPR
jgi:nucleoside-triphosphatase THEP1